MASPEKTTVIVMRESFVTSVVRDVVSVATLLGAVGIGLWVGSTALQWVAALVWVLWLFGRSITLLSNSKMTVAQARARLDEIEAE